MSKKILDSCIEKIKEFKKQLSPQDELHIVFWGGEPTLEYKHIDYVIEQTKDIINQYFTSSNGYDLEKRIPLLQKWIKHNFKFQVSYDLEPMQSLNRLTPLGTSSNDAVLNTLYALAKNKIPFNIKSTLDFDHLTEIENIYYNFKKLRSEINKIDNQNDLTLAITLVTDEITKKPTKTLLNTFNTQLSNILTDIIKTNPKHNFGWFNFNRQLCSAGESSICIDCDGIVYICHGALFSSNKHLHIKGNITKDSIKNMLGLESFNKQSSDCDKCDSRFCFRCPIHTFDKSKKENYFDRMIDYACDKNYCFIQKEISKYSYALLKLQRESYGVYNTNRA
jgi:radical SAM protein with 4Fe4S-binding SPASM domain